MIRSCVFLFWTALKATLRLNLICILNLFVDMKRHSRNGSAAAEGSSVDSGRQAKSSYTLGGYESPTTRCLRIITIGIMAIVAKRFRVLKWLGHNYL